MEMVSDEAKVSESESARARVEQELSDLLDKITNLTKFYYGQGMLKAKLSKEMQTYLFLQLEHMKQYAHYLQCRLKIWGKADEELAEERHVQ